MKKLTSVFVRVSLIVCILVSSNIAMARYGKMVPGEKSDSHMFSHPKILATFKIRVEVTVKNAPKGFDKVMETLLRKITGWARLLDPKDGKLFFEAQCRGGGEKLVPRLLNELNKKRKYKSLTVTTSTKYKIELTFPEKKPHRKDGQTKHRKKDHK